MATNEYNATLHSTDLPALDALCDGTLVFWPSLVGTPHEKCQPGDRVAFADYTKIDTALYTRESQKTFTGSYNTLNGNGMKIWDTGNHIKYDNIDAAFLATLS